MTFDINKLYSIGFNSKNRAQALLDLLKDSPPQIFWPAFQQVWPDCDDTWLLQDDIVAAMRLAGDARPFLQGADKSFIEALPKDVTIYRGCSRSRVRGLSWTTDLSTAKAFARGHRGIKFPDAVVATSIVPSWCVRTAFTVRDEAEVLIDPASLSGFSTEAVQ
ncbi:hypothetical protein [Ochrobactrum sp. MYb379]|uniref:hypothetical protein n=1 Tax=Ochrobactrum sp. MYb379 TaxID=2745275 RepID=UPI00309CB9B8